MAKITKVKALINLLGDNGGAASWQYIYENIERYYPNAKAAKSWDAALRGVLYREWQNGRHFKRIGLGVYALIDYQEQEIVERIMTDEVRMHSYIEGLLVETGNHENYDTYCSDKTAVFQGNVPIGQLSSIDDIPDFTYPEIIQIVKRIDVVWLNKYGYKFPRKAIEVVNSIGTLEQALNRMYQIKEFQTDFLIVSPHKFVNRITRKLRQEPYSIHSRRFEIRNYEQIIAYHRSLLEVERLRF